jgi:hypothetical protein
MALIGGPILFFQGFRDLRRKRLMENTPTARIRSMAMGLAEINGRIIARSGVTAPFSGQPCAYWQVDISTPAPRNSWDIVHRATSGNTFFLRDETGLALVYPHDAECKINFGISEVCGGMSLPPCYADYLKTLGPEHHLWRAGNLRFRERTLEEGQRIYVLGTAQPRSQVLTISEGEELAATGTEGASVRRMQALDHEVAAVIRRGEHEKTFIISQQSEQQMVADLSGKVFLKIIGGPILTVLGLGFWLLYFA